MKGDFSTLIRSQFHKMPPYEPILPFDVLSEKLGIAQERLVKLDANENPYGPVPGIGRILANLDLVNIYPDPESRRIRNLLSDYHQIPADSIVIGAGADELIDLTMRLVAGPADKVINCPPTFGMYAFDGAVNGSEVIEVPRRSDFSIDLDRLSVVAEVERPKIIFLANPNNPDGGLTSPEGIRRLLAMPLLVVVDEAYINFAPPGYSWLNHVADHDNLIVLRTFSKWAGLAGLRIGYGVFPSWLRPLVMKAKQPYNVSVAAEAAACRSIEMVQILEERAAKIISERARLERQLAQIDWLEPYPTAANFILCRVAGRPAVEVKQKLMEQGLLIRYFDKPGLTDHIRITVGKPVQSDVLIEALRALE